MLIKASRSRSVVLYADDAPRRQTPSSGPQHRYRNPRIQLEERSLPPLPAGWIRVQIAYAGICGTDVHLLEKAEDGYTRSSCPATIPPEGRIIGHEGVGFVRECGAGVDNVGPGDCVCLESIVSCKSCEKCRQGNFNQCERSVLIGMEEDGLFTEHADVPASLAHRVNDLANRKRNLEGLACVEPAAVAYLACVNARFRPGENVAVFGAGPIGYYVAMMARTLFGAAQVTVAEPLPFRREFAGRVCDRVTGPGEFAADRQTYDVLVDAAGDLAGVSATLRKMRGNGRIILLSRTGMAFHTDQVDQIISKSLHLIGSRGHLGGAMNAVLSLVRTDRLDLRAPVTRVAKGMDELGQLLSQPSLIMAGDCKILAKLMTKPVRTI